MRIISALLLSVACSAGVAVAGDPSLWLSGRVSTVAGVPGIGGYQDGPVHVAEFNRPTWLDVVDGDSCSGGVDGDIYVIDRLNQAIRKISGGVVSTHVLHASTDRPPFVFDFGVAFGGGIVMEPPEGGCGCFTYARGMFITSSGTDQVVLLSLLAGHLGNRDGDQIIGQRGVAGAADGFASLALFNNPGGLARSWKYPNFNHLSERWLYVADTGITPFDASTSVHRLSFVQALAVS